MSTVQGEVSGIASTGIAGLDDILGGGFTRNRMYLIEGVPGSGKTTLGLQFLMAGARAGERTLYVTLSETEDELRTVAATHGWRLDGMAIRELAPSEAELEPEEQSTMLHPPDMELAATTMRVLEDVERIQAVRVVFDSLSELRLLAGNPLRYRRQILALKQYFARRHCTVMLLDDLTATAHDLQMRSIAHGVVALEELQSQYGSQRRRLRVAKYRGMAYRGGYHDYAIRTGGLEVFPRLVAAEHRQAPERGPIGSGVAGLDALLGGGIEEGTSTLILGSAGTGKSTIAAQFVHAAARQGRRAAMFLFDESPQTLLARCRQLNVDLETCVAEGTVRLQQVDPAEMTPGELVHVIRREVEAQARIVVIDSLNGYLNAMPEERFLTVQLHELLMYLGQRNVASILIGAYQGIVGAQLQVPVDASYLADTVILLRYFEEKGAVRQAVSVMKKRSGPHERTIRAFQWGRDGIVVGEPLQHLRGVLTGIPVYDTGAPLS